MERSESYSYKKKKKLQKIKKNENQYGCEYVVDQLMATHDSWRRGLDWNELIKEILVWQLALVETESDEESVSEEDLRCVKA